MQLFAEITELFHLIMCHTNELDRPEKLALVMRVAMGACGARKEPISPKATPDEVFAQMKSWAAEKPTGIAIN